MALISTMGAPSSPLFLTGDTAIGVDLSGLDYYYKKKEAADEKLADKLKKQAPEIKEFDQKIDALPGQKLHLYEQYVEKRNKVSEGVKKYGGVWAIYANTPEGRADLGAMGEDPYSFTMAEKNLQRWDDVSKKMTSDGLGKNIYIDQNFRAQGIKDKDGRIRYARNEDFLQEQSRAVPLDEKGRIASQDYSITTGDSEDFIKEVSAFATKAGSSSSETAQPVLGTYYDEATGTYKKGSSVLGGNDAYNYIMNTESGSSSNKRQLRDAQGVIANSLSTEAQQGVWQEIYAANEGKGANGRGSVTYWNADTNQQEYIDYDKLDNDEVYRNEVYQGYVAKRVRDTVKPLETTTSKSKSSLQSMGAATGQGEYEKEKATQEGYVALFATGQIQGDETRNEISYVYDPKAKKYVPQQYQTQILSNQYLDSQLAGQNKTLETNPVTLNGAGVKNFIYKGTNNVVGANSGMGNAQITRYNGLQTGNPLVKEGGTYREASTEEVANYDRIMKIDESSRTNADKEFIDKTQPGLYWNVSVVIPEGTIDNNQGPKYIDENGQPVDAVGESSGPFWYGVNNIATSEEGSIQNVDGDYKTDVLIPAMRGTQLVGSSAPQENATLSRFEQEQQLIIDNIFNNQLKLQQDSQNANNFIYR
tara:strand:+ start:811 stop:2748 length:1938 start_codon:yes stop_codon:yes gene_type:complete